MNELKKLIWDLSSKTVNFRGKERIVSLLARPKGLDHIKIKRGDVNFFVHGHDLNEFTLAVRKNHSELVSTFLNSEIESRQLVVMWDIGANIGAISLPLLKMHRDLTSVLFEPSAEVAGRLIRNIAINPELHSRCLVMNVALSNNSCLNNFYVSNEDFNSGVAGLGCSQNREKFPVMVQTYTGDELVSSGKCPAPQIIKIDTEGFELEVLQGLRSTLTNHKPILVFEHSIYRLNERNQAVDTIAKFLESFGYKIYRISDRRRAESVDYNTDADFAAIPG